MGMKNVATETKKHGDEKCNYRDGKNMEMKKMEMKKKHGDEKCSY